MLLLLACTPLSPIALQPAAPDTSSTDTGTRKIPPDTATTPDTEIDMTPPADGPLPVIRVDANGRIQADRDTPGTVEVILQHDGTLQDLLTAPVAWSSPMTIEIRGSSSESFDKHSYGVELEDDAGLGVEIPLLGLPKESDWVFYGPYNDKTYLRDAFTYSLARQMGQYAPRTTWFEFVLDGKYQGIYLLVEKIKRDGNRVDIPPPAASGAEGDITGGYIYKREDSGEPDGWNSAMGNYYNFHDPSAAQITTEQAKYLKRWVDGMEASFKVADPGDPLTGFPSKIDIDSFVDFAILQELSHNVDGYRKSAYFYKKADADGGKVFAGPVWDFNIAYGNADYCDGWKLDELVYQGRNVCADLQSVPRWWDTLYANPAFTTPLRCRWNTLRQGVLADTAMMATLSDLGRLLGDAEKRDHATWPVIGQHLWPNYYVGNSYAEELEYLQDWITGRAAWLDGNLPGDCP